MKRNRYLNLGKRLSVIAMTLALALSYPISASGSTLSTGVCLGTGTVYWANGDINYDIVGYVYYNENSSTELDLSSLAQRIYNYGVYDVNEVFYEAADGSQDNWTTDGGQLDGGISAGENARVEADWEYVCGSQGRSHTYAKDGDENAAYTNIAAGLNGGMLGGWISHWKPYTREDLFVF